MKTRVYDKQGLNAKVGKIVAKTEYLQNLASQAKTPKKKKMLE
ncbi:hypothetical protein [Tenacibaculum mesophilum]|nr:hypothetical protein KUL113_55140 [Tenacibaculum sp. KUL113]